jgi:hypothetical protein
LSQATWSYPATNRLLFEAGTSVVRNSMRVDPADTGVSLNDISILEQSTGYRYNARIGNLTITSYNFGDVRHTSDQVNGRFSTSYVTGSHALKAGLQVQVGEQFTYAQETQAIDYTFRNGQPLALRLWASPLALRSHVRPNLGILEPNTMFEKRLTQVDLRVTKVVRLRDVRLQGMFDVYNAFNANTVLALNNTYGSTWLRPTAILAGRLFKFGVQLDF